MGYERALQPVLLLLIARDFRRSAAQQARQVSCHVLVPRVGEALLLIHMYVLFCSWLAGL